MNKAQRKMLLYILIWAFFIPNDSQSSPDKISTSVTPSPQKGSATIEPKVIKIEETKKLGALSEDLYWLCRNALEVRTVRVEKQTEFCVTIYTKQGRDEEVLRAKRINSCAPMVSKVKSNLEKGGWICKNISDSSISR